MPDWRRIRSVFSRVLLGALAIELAWLVLANAFLASKLTERLVATDDGNTLLRYRRAFSPYPFRVWVEDLEIQRQDDKEQFLIGIDEAWTTIWVPQLFAHVFHATDTDARGVRFYVRHRVPEGTKVADEARFFPPIGNYESLVAPSIAEQRATDSGPSPWTFRLEGVHAQAREFWIQEYRHVLDGWATGAFAFQPGKRLWVDAGLGFRGGPITMGDTVVASNTDGEVHVTIPPFDPMSAPNLEVFRHVDARGRIDATTQDASFLDVYRFEDARFQDGSGALHVVADLRAGVFQPGSMMTYETSHLAASRGEWRATVAGRLDWRLETLGENRFALRADGRAARGGTAPIEVAGALFALDFRGGDVAAPWTVRGVDAAVDDVFAPSLHVLDPVLAKNDVHVDNGSAHVHGHAHIDPVTGSVTGHARVRGDGLVVRIDDTRIHGELSAYAEAEPSVGGVMRVRDGRIDLRGVDVQRKGFRTSGWWAKIVLGDGRVAEGGLPEASTAFTYESKDGTPILAFLLGDGLLPKAIDGVIRDHELRAQGNLAFAGRDGTLALTKVREAPFDLTGKVRFGRGSPTGNVVLGCGPVAVGLKVGNGGLTVTTADGAKGEPEEPRDQAVR